MQQDPETEEEDDLEEDAPEWHWDDLAPRLAEAKPGALRMAAQAGPERLETYLRGLVGQPPSRRVRIGLDSQEAVDFALLASEAQNAVTEMLSEQVPETLWPAISEALDRIDPTGTLREDFEGMRPAGPGF